MAESILIADDDRSIQLTISTALVQAGYAPVCVSDGDEARTRIQSGEERFSAVLLDWEMPKMTGIDLLRWLKQQAAYRDLPVVMQTSRDSTENIQEGIEEVVLNTSLPLLKLHKLSLAFVNRWNVRPGSR